MKTLRNFSLLLFASLFLFAFTESNKTKHEINTEKSQISWVGHKVTGKHEGTINIKSGSFTYEGDKLVGGSFIIDMASIICTDLDGEYKGKLEGHLKSADFFGVDKYPTAKFEITKVVHRGTPGAYKIVGNLTIKETTKEIKFNAEVAKSDDIVKAEGAMVVDRSDYNIKYGSGSFFDNLGDKTIYDEFDLNVMVVTSN